MPAEMRITLHAGILNRSFLLWGESDRPTRARAGATFGIDARAIRACAARVIDAPEQRTPTVTNVVAWLPTRAGLPLTSAVIAPAQRKPAGTAGVAQTTISPWTVRAATLDAAAFIDVLGACSGRQLLDEDLAVGNDLAYWSHVARFAAEIVAAQQYLPTITHDVARQNFRAVWQPVLAQRERRHAAELAAAMPAVCRAIAASDTMPPDRSAAAAFSAGLETFVDALVRSCAPTALPRSTASSLHTRWLDALQRPDPTLSGTPAELADFAMQIEAWRRPVLDDHASPYRLCLRVEEPPGDEDLWHVTYLLQSHTDLSLLIDARQAQRSAPLRRALLAALGKAATFSPEVDRSLQSGEALPAEFGLETRAVVPFLTTAVGRFEAAGIGVILPAWWLGKETKTRISLRGQVKRKGLASGLLSNMSVLEVNWRVALGDDTLSVAELQRIAKLKSPLVNVRGRWVHVDATEIRAALDRLKRGAREITAGDAVRMSLGITVADLPTGTLLEPDDVVDDFIKRVRGEGTPVTIAPPAGLRAELRPYQARGLSWLHFLTHTGFGACLADDMGLGKTIQTLALILHNWEAGERAPVLLVCPTSVIGNWSREAERFAPDLPIYVHHGTARDRDATFTRTARSHAIVLTSYALLQRDVAMFSQVAWGGAVLDEAQNIKNSESKGARAAYAIEAGYRIALTGTPVENHVGDLWSIVQFLNPGMLGSAAAFKREFFIPIQALGDVEAAQRLRTMTGPFVLRRLKSDKAIIADLPAKDEHKVFCTLTREQASLYAAVLRDLDTTIEAATGIERRGLILATLSKLKQICNHPAQFNRDNSPLPGRSGKLARLEEMLEEVLQSGEAALVFTQFAEMGTLIARRLRGRFGIDIPFLHGGVAKLARDEMVERFCRERGPAVFVLSLKAGGSGLNLTRANHVFHFDRWWNPAVENQATDRAFRIGQTRAVGVHKFICGGTLEDKIDALIDQKQAISERVVGTGEGWLTELSTTQLRELVALGPDAVSD